MENFVKVFLVAVLILLVGVAMSIRIFKVPGMVKRDNITIYSVSIPSFGEIGEASRTIMLGDVSVGETTGTDLVVNASNVVVKNGLFSSNSQSFVVNGKNITRIIIEGEISETNLYGDLIIKVNGKDVYHAKTSPQKIKIVVNNVNPTHNEVEISCESSGLKFWAPTTYVFSYLKIYKVDYTYREYTKGFVVYPYEIDGFKKGEIVFNVDEAIKNEDLCIDINNVNVYCARPQESPLPYKIDFDKASVNLAAGENTLRIYSGKNSAYKLRDVRINIYYYGATHKSYRSYEFNIDERLLETMRKENRTLVVVGKVGTLNARGVLEIRLNGRDDCALEFPIRTDYEIFSQKIKLSCLKPGTNILSVATTGSFDVERVSLMLAR